MAELLLELFSEEIPANLQSSARVELLENFKVRSSGKLPRMSSMLVGYFSYDVIRLIEKIPDNCKNDIDIPEIRLMRPRNLVIYDNLQKKIFFIENIFREEIIKDYNLKYQ